MQNKAEIRKHLRQKRMQIKRPEREKAEQQVRRFIKPFLKRGKKIGFYLAVGSELNLSKIVADAKRQGCQLYVPYITHSQKRLWFTPYPPTRKQRGRKVMNIMQYEGSKKRIEQLDMVLMPLVGIDNQGMRLGQGGGFYDTSLSYCRVLQPLRIGIGFAAQRHDHIPSEQHDQALDAFVCERGISRFSARMQYLQTGYRMVKSD